MPARATSSGTISFGLVSIPVKLYTATSSKAVHFSMLHAKDSSRVRQQYVCQTCGEIVERTDTVKGYEHSRDQYVVLSEEELKGLERKSDRTIEIEEFVPIAQVDPLYFEKSNLLGPDKGGARAYRLLREAMREAGMVAIGRYSTRGRQQLVLLRPYDAGLVLHGLYYSDEVRSFADVDLGDEVETKPGELDLAKQLIAQLTSERFEPQRYRDEYRDAVLEAVERKVAGAELVAAPREEQREQIIDLVAALKKSLAEKRAAAGEATPLRDRRPAKARGKGGAKRQSASS